MALVMTMDSEDLTFLCPCCQSTLGLDDSGDLIAIVDSRPGKTGIRGIKSVTEGGKNNDWQEAQYRATEPKQYQPPIERLLGLAGKPEEPIHAPEILEANKNDLKQRNIKTN